MPALLLPKEKLRANPKPAKQNFPNGVKHFLNNFLDYSEHFEVSIAFCPVVGVEIRLPELLLPKRKLRCH